MWKLIQLQEEIRKGKGKIQSRRRWRRTQWTRELLLRRPMLGQYEKVVQELKREDHKSYKNFLRIDDKTS